MRKSLIKKKPDNGEAEGSVASARFVVYNRLVMNDTRE